MRLTGGPLGETVALPQLLAAGLARDADAPALVEQHERWSWREVDVATDRLAAGYLSLGLKPGDRVASLIPNRCSLFIHYHACFKAGLVVVPLNYRYMAQSIDHALAASRSRVLVAHSERLAELDTCREVAGLDIGIVTFEHEGDEGRARFEDLIAVESDERDFPVPAPDAPAAIFFTSGSTGTPKGVTHTGRSLSAAFRVSVEAFEITAEDRVLPGSSCSHLGGFMWGFSALSAGVPTVIARTYSGQEILALLRETRPTILCMIPAALFSVVREPGASVDDFASLRLCRSGADKVPLELEREYEALTGHEIDEGYGCSEAGLISLNPPSGLIIPGSVGRILPGIEASIRNDEGVEVHFTEDGNLWIKSPTLMQGYWENEEATNASIRDSWFDTGDRMTANDEGYLWFRGRKKQIIVHDGSNIYPQEVEDALGTHPSVHLAGVIGIDDTVHGETVRAYVALRPGSEASPDELIAHARQSVGYKAPEEIIFIEEMPLNPTGKVDRVTLKTMAAERHHPTDS